MATAGDYNVLGLKPTASNEEVNMIISRATA